MGLKGTRRKLAASKKHAIRSGWRFVVPAVAPTTLALLISVAGLQVGAGLMGKGGLSVGEEPAAGLWALTTA